MVIGLVASGAALPGLCGVALGQTSTALDLEFDGSVYHVETAHHRGYSAVRWSRIPAALTSRSFQAHGTATAIIAGAPLELRVGSPFGRHGTTVFQLANEPYAEGGEVWVPLELFTDWLTEEQTTGAPPPAVDETSTNPAAPAADYRLPGPWRVVIDAGHGGHDPGTISPRTGVREKDITLAVARKVADELEARGGFQPLLTRSRDEFVKVMDRPSMAVDLHADLFISIHVDAQPGGRSSASGFTTFYLGRARTDDALQVALRENAVIELEEGSEPPNIAQVERVLAMMDGDAYRMESSRLAGFIQNGLRGVVDSRDRGAKPGPYYVLLTPGLRPAVLVELGFITHPGDEQKLTSEAAQNRIARALADMIDRYLTEAGRRIATMEGRG